MTDSSAAPDPRPWTLGEHGHPVQNPAYQPPADPPILAAYVTVIVQNKPTAAETDQLIDKVRADLRNPNLADGWPIQIQTTGGSVSS